MRRGTIVKPILPLLRTYWFIFRPRTRGVKCVIERNGNILMIRNSYGRNLWTFPGGGIEKRETAEQAAKREVFEEVGIKVKEIRKIGEFVSTIEYKRDTVTVFAGKSDTDRFKIDPMEILEAKWFSPDHLPEISEYAKEVTHMWEKSKMSI